MNVFNYTNLHVGFYTSPPFPIQGTVCQSPFDGCWYEAVNALDQYGYPMVVWVYIPDPTPEPYLAQEPEPLDNVDFPSKKEPFRTKMSNRQKHEIFTKHLRSEIIKAIAEKRFDKNRILVLNLFKVFGDNGHRIRRLAEEDEENAKFWKQNKLSLPMADVREVLPEWLTITCQPADENHYWPRILLHMKGFRP